MSHNIYVVNKEDTLENLPNYLIIIENPENHQTFITPCNTITKVIDIAKSEKRICSVFEKVGTNTGKFWKYMMDVSHGVL